VLVLPVGEAVDTRASMKGSSRKNCKAPGPARWVGAVASLNEGQFPKNCKDRRVARRSAHGRRLNEGQSPKELQVVTPPRKPPSPKPQ